jgi:hypothetical protein
MLNLGFILLVRMQIINNMQIITREASALAYKLGF